MRFADECRFKEPVRDAQATVGTKIDAGVVDVGQFLEGNLAADAYGIEKSVVSEQFIEASRQKLRELMERPLGDLKLCAVMIDGIAFDGETFVVALGIGQDGHKTVLGLRQGATENATVVGELCAELEQRGVDFQEPRLYVLDGAKALNVAVKKRAGEAALLQRCQLHKRRNVLNHLPEEQQPFMEQKLCGDGLPCGDRHAAPLLYRQPR